MRLVPNFTEEEFTALYNQLVPKLLAFAQKWSGDQTLAEDMVQEAFVKLWKKRFEIDLNETTEHLLYTMVRNELINSYQKKLKERKVSSNLKIVQNDPTNEELQLEKLQNLNRYIEELPPRCKEVFILSKREGLTYQEIAAELSLSVKSVEKHISKALRILRKRLG